MRKLSDRLSVKCMHCDKTEERSVHIFTPYNRSFSLDYLRVRFRNHIIYLLTWLKNVTVDLTSLDV